MDPIILILGGLGLLAMAKPKAPLPGQPIQVPGMPEGPRWELFQAPQVPVTRRIQPAPPAPPDLGTVLKATAGQAAKAAAKAGIQIGVKKVAAPVLAAGAKALLGKLGVGSIAGTGKLAGLGAVAGPAAVVAIPLAGAVMATFKYFESRKKKKKKRKAWRIQRAEYGAEMRAGGDVMARQLLADYKADKGLLITRGEAREAFLGVYPKFAMQFMMIGHERMQRVAKEQRRVLQEAGFALPRGRGGMERPTKAYIVPRKLIPGFRPTRVTLEAPALRVTKREALILATTGKIPGPAFGMPQRRPAGGIR